MDHDVKAFRAAAARENGTRTGLQRRYSSGLRAQAVRVLAAYGSGRVRRCGTWQWRWASRRGVCTDGRGPRRHRRAFMPCRSCRRSRDHATLVVVVGAGHTRVEGLDVASVARLLALMR